MRLVSLALVMVGLAVSGYLMSRYLELVSSAGQVKPGVCSTVFDLDCDAALASPMSNQLGLPLAGWGIVYYGCLAALSISGWLIGNPFYEVATRASFFIAIPAALASVVLLVVMGAGIAPFCPLCVVTHIVNLVLVPVLKRATGQSLRQLAGSLASGFKLVCNSQVSMPLTERFSLVALWSTALVGLLLYQGVNSLVLLYPAPEFDVRDVVADFAMTERVRIPLLDDAPRLGPAHPRLQLVVFTDFQCPGCRLFAEKIGEAIADSDGLGLVFKHFPANTACNSSVSEDLHPRACEAAYAAEAAKRQGKFWEYHDQLFQSNLHSREVRLEQIAGKLGLQIERFEQDRRATLVRERVRRDIELGIQLGVKETPAVFLNGRRLPDIRLQSLGMCFAAEQARLKSLDLEADTPKTGARSPAKGSE